jgi:hypothetical protein
VSIAWGSLVLLVVLLPGVLFFVGIYWPEQFTRETELRSPLGQLAGALLIAFFVHGAAYAVLSSFCGGFFPCISVGSLLQTINVDPRNPPEVRAVGEMLRQFRWWIFLYVLAAAGLGIFFGGLYGYVVAKGKFRGFSRHSWIYALSVDGLTYAYVLTKVAFEDRMLMYKGFLRAFGLQQDGRFSYIVLTDVTRMYMNLPATGSETSGVNVQKMIGASTPGQVILPAEPSKPKKRVHSLFVIDGAEVSNAVFDVLETEAQAVGSEELRTLLRQEASAIGLELSDKDIDDIIKSSD